MAANDDRDNVPTSIYYGGCQSIKDCPNCKVRLTCNSSGKIENPAQDLDKGVYYVDGPCCEGLQTCPNCGHKFFDFSNIRYYDGVLTNPTCSSIPYEIFPAKYSSLEIILILQQFNINISQQEIEERLGH